MRAPGWGKAAWRLAGRRTAGGADAHARPSEQKRDPNEGGKPPPSSRATAHARRGPPAPLSRPCACVPRGDAFPLNPRRFSPHPLFFPSPLPPPTRPSPPRFPRRPPGTNRGADSPLPIPVATAIERKAAPLSSLFPQPRRAWGGGGRRVIASRGARGTHTRCPSFFLPPPSALTSETGAWRFAMATAERSWRAPLKKWKWSLQG